MNIKKIFVFYSLLNFNSTFSMNSFNLNLNQNDCHLDLPLSRAAFCADTETVKNLLSNNANPNIIINDESPLTSAIDQSYGESNKKLIICKLLLKSGANPNELLKDFSITQKTPLTKAIQELVKYSNLDRTRYKNIKKIIKTLLLYGANPNLKITQTKKWPTDEYNFETAIEFINNLKLVEILEIFEEYKKLRKERISILLSYIKPRLPIDMINLITQLSLDY